MVRRRDAARVRTGEEISKYRSSDCCRPQRSVARYDQRGQQFPWNSPPDTSASERLGDALYRSCPESGGHIANRRLWQHDEQLRWPPEAWLTAAERTDSLNV